MADPIDAPVAAAATRPLPAAASAGIAAAPATPAEAAGGPRLAVLADRAVIGVGGPDAAAFLQSLITASVADIAEGGAAFGALLTPQGKILFDFLIARTAAGFLLDVAADRAAALAQRLAFYRLRAKVTVAAEDRTVVAAWDGAPAATPGIAAFADPRLAALGHRLLVPPASLAAVLSGGRPVAAAEYHRHRIRLAVPEGGRDFAFGETFPHEADMDQLAGVDFGKGCYVGQEIVSRMQHRGTARRRIIAVAASSALPPPATPILTGGREVGVLGSADGDGGLALVRLDRVREALDRGLAVTADGVELGFSIPPWAAFGWPQPAQEDS